MKVGKAALLLPWEAAIQTLLKMAAGQPAVLDVLRIPSIVKRTIERRKLLAENGIVPSWESPVPRLEDEAKRHWPNPIPD